MKLKELSPHDKAFKVKERSTYGKRRVLTGQEPVALVTLEGYSWDHIGPTSLLIQ